MAGTTSARGGKLVHFKYVNLPQSEEDRISKLLASYISKYRPTTSRSECFVSCDVVHWEERASSSRCLQLKPNFVSGDRGGDVRGAQSKPKGSGRGMKHQEESSKVPRRRQPDRHLPAPEAVGATTISSGVELLRRKCCPCSTCLRMTTRLSTARS